MPNNGVYKCSVDFGNVIIENFSKEDRDQVAEICRRDTVNQEELEKFLLEKSRLLPDALRGLKRLVELYGKENVFVVSRVNTEEVEVDKLLFKVNKICECAGLSEENIYFVEKYSDKVDTCWRLGIVSHIDDRGEVLSHMCGRILRLVWFNPTKEDVSKWRETLGTNVVRVNNWAELIPLLG